MSQLSIRQPIRTASLLRMLGFCLCGVLMVACEPMVDTRGHVDEREMKTVLKVGVNTREDVERLFGSPSSRSNFGEETWYYIRTRKESQAFFKPEITDQKVTELVFEPSGVLKGMREYGNADATGVQVVEKVTPTEGHSLGFFEQLLGNVGRFNKGRDATSSAPRRY